jgi:hypothetical protein
LLAKVTVFLAEKALQFSSNILVAHTCHFSVWPQISLINLHKIVTYCEAKKTFSDDAEETNLKSFYIHVNMCRKNQERVKTMSRGLATDSRQVKLPCNRLQTNKRLCRQVSDFSKGNKSAADFKSKVPRDLCILF